MSEQLIYVNIPTAEEALASELQDICHLIDMVRWTEDLSGAGANMLYLAWKKTAELSDALQGRTPTPPTPKG